jgi:hypothetical protein
MSESFLGDLWVHTGGQQMRGVAVAEELAIGEALVSFLEGNGVPSVVERTRIRPPTARLGVVSADYRRAVIARSPLKGKYDTRIEPLSFS